MIRHDTTVSESATVSAIRALVIAAAAVLFAFLIPVSAEPAAAGLTAVSYSLAVVVAALLLRPDHATSSRSILAWCLFAVCMTSAMILFNSTTRQLWPLLPRLLATQLLLVATLYVVARHIPIAVLTALFAALTLAPVWAAPLVEFTGNPSWLNALVIHASPITALSVAVDLDYLRTDWFYANSALGSMRYSYPGWAEFCLALAIPPAGALFFERLRARRNSNAAISKEAYP